MKTLSNVKRASEIKAAAPATRGFGAAKHNWTKMLDGDVNVLQKGVDFDVLQDDGTLSPSELTMRAMIASHAKLAGVGVKVVRLQADEHDNGELVAKKGDLAVWSVPIDPEEAAKRKAHLLAKRAEWAAGRKARLAAEAAKTSGGTPAPKATPAAAPSVKPTGKPTPAGQKK